MAGIVADVNEDELVLPLCPLNCLGIQELPLDQTRSRALNERALAGACSVLQSRLLARQTSSHTSLHGDRSSGDRRRCEFGHAHLGSTDCLGRAIWSTRLERGSAAR